MKSQGQLKWSVANQPAVDWDESAKWINARKSKCGDSSKKVERLRQKTIDEKPSMR